jgi:hypothetical protein
VRSRSNEFEISDRHGFYTTWTASAWDQLFQVNRTPTPALLSLVYDVGPHNLNDAYASGFFMDPTVSNHVDGWNITSRDGNGGYKSRESLSQRGLDKKWGAHKDNWDGGAEDRIFAYEFANWDGGGVPGGPDDSPAVVFESKPKEHDADWMDWTGNFRLDGSPVPGQASKPGVFNPYVSKVIEEPLRTFFF